MKTVLVVDDERQIATIASDYLRHAGFGVITADNGVQALAAARARRPDLIVLDLGLPRMDGLDVARALRRPLPHRRLEPPTCPRSFWSRTTR